MKEFGYTQNFEYFMSDKAEPKQYGVRDDQKIYAGAYDRPTVIDSESLGQPVKYF